MPPPARSAASAFVAKFMGDGVLAYFGFPRAFEDVDRCANGAFRGILAEVGGMVVVGEIVGFGTAQERTIVGDTPNLAARRQALAEPDTILISEATQSLLGGLFHLQFGLIPHPAVPAWFLVYWHQRPPLGHRAPF
jgi:class 3 adenylate cyclase